jgi:hypothetical protein
LPLATYVAVTLTVPVGRFSEAIATPFVSAVATGALAGGLGETVYVKFTVPVGVPAAEATAAVNCTGTPPVVVVVFDVSVVDVAAAVTASADVPDIDPPLTLSPP